MACRHGQSDFSLSDRMYVEKRKYLFFVGFPHLHLHHDVAEGVLSWGLMWAVHIEVQLGRDFLGLTTKTWKMRVQIKIG